MKEPTTRLRISLANVSPQVWRRVEVSLHTTLGELHQIIQSVMGWWDYHLYKFEIGDERYGQPSPEDFEEIRDDRSVDLEMLIDRNISQITYIYDFGDYWEHKIRIGATRTGAADIDYPVFLGGENNCPPEDVGGPSGYQEYLSAIADPNHEDHEAMLQWNGEDFDPSFVDKALINEQLEIMAKLRKIRSRFR